MSLFVFGVTVLTLILPFSGLLPVLFLGLVAWKFEQKMDSFYLVEKPMAEGLFYLFFILLVVSVFELSFSALIYRVVFGVIVVLSLMGYTHGSFLALTFSDLPDDVEKYTYIVVLDFIRPRSFCVVTFECFLGNERCFLNGFHEIGVEEVMTFKEAGARAFKMYINM